MKAKELWTVIDTLQNTSGSNDKKEYLKKFTGNEVLYKYLRYVYDEVHYVYGKSKVPEIPQVINKVEDDSELVEFFELIDDMNSGVLKGNLADEAMIDYCILKDLYYEDLLFYVVKRNIKANINAKGINEVFGHIIPIASYMRCESESYMKKRIRYSTKNEKGEIILHGALAESKADGAFLNTQIFKNYDDVVSTTRYGREVPPDKFLNTLSAIPVLLKWENDYVMHGELLLKHPDGTIMDRQTGNGKINKYIKRKTTEIELQKKIDTAKSVKSEVSATKKYNEHVKEWDYISKNLVYEVWDLVLLEDWKNLYSDETTIKRFLHVKQAVDLYNEMKNILQLDLGNCELRLIDHKLVFNDDEAMIFYQEQLDAGLEGMVIKNLDIPWCHDVNRDGIIKLKDFKESDFIITGIKMADEDSDFAGGIGSYIMESSDGLVQVNVSGMKRHERGLERVDSTDSSKGLQLIEDFDFEQNIGKIAAVKYNELIKSKNSDYYSLFLPNVLEIRESSDKTQADDISKIKKVSKYKGK